MKRTVAKYCVGNGEIRKYICNGVMEQIFCPSFPESDIIYEAFNNITYQ